LSDKNNNDTDKTAISLKNKGISGGAGEITELKKF
jgi:hypothetical protein